MSNFSWYNLIDSSVEAESLNHENFRDFLCKNLAKLAQQDEWKIFEVLSKEKVWKFSEKNFLSLFSFRCRRKF
jgi:hypothetical protein